MYLGMDMGEQAGVLQWPFNLAFEFCLLSRPCVRADHNVIHSQFLLKKWPFGIIVDFVPRVQ